jgi:hypothetical protein
MPVFPMVVFSMRGETMGNSIRRRYIAGLRFRCRAPTLPREVLGTTLKLLILSAGRFSAKWVIVFVLSDG